MRHSPDRHGRRLARAVKRSLADVRRGRQVVGAAQQLELEVPVPERYAVEPKALQLEALTARVTGGKVCQQAGPIPRLGIETLRVAASLPLHMAAYDS